MISDYLYHRIMEKYDVEERRLIVVPANEHEANNAVEKYIQRENVSVVGFDCEWNSRDDFDRRDGFGYGWDTRDKYGRDYGFNVAVLQIATDECVILFQTTKFECPNTLPRRLRDVLLDRCIIKVGVGIEKDIERLESQFFYSISSETKIACFRGWLDLRCLLVTKVFYGQFLLEQYYGNERNICHLTPEKANEKRAGFMPKLGLETLAKNCLRKKLEKSEHVCFNSNWERKVLSDNQKLYAAADASASLEVFYALNTLNEGWSFRRGNLFHGVFITIKDLPGPRHCILPNAKWKPVVEEKYHHTRIRLFCLNIISFWDPDPLLDKYYCNFSKGKTTFSYGGQSQGGCTIIPDDEFENVFDKIPHRRSVVVPVPVEGVLSYFIYNQLVPFCKLIFSTVMKGMEIVIYFAACYFYFILILYILIWTLKYLGYHLEPPTINE